MESIEAPPSRQIEKPKQPIWLYIGLGCAALFLVVLALGFFAYKAYSSTQKDSTKEARQILAELGEDWDPDVFWNHFSIAAKESSPREDVNKLTAFFSDKLGSLKRIDSLDFEQVSSYTGVGTTTTFHGLITCEKGNATVRMILLKVGDEWQLHDFHLNSNTFIDLDEYSDSPEEESSNES